MKNTEAVSPIEVEIERRLKRMAEAARLKQKERLDFMATQPQVIRCNVHPAYERVIDEQRTAEATSRNHGQHQAGYTPCPACVEAEKLAALIACGLPSNLKHATFENFAPEDEADAGHAETVKQFCEVRRGFLIMLGNHGTGKSHLSAAALRAFGKGWFVKQSTLLGCLRNTYRNRQAFDPLERAQGARLFILDDAGLSAGGKDELPLLHEILDYRHGERLPTIITSNLDYEQLEDVIGLRMVDRLRESAFRVLTFAGGSHRREARERYFD